MELEAAGEALGRCGGRAYELSSNHTCAAALGVKTFSKDLEGRFPYRMARQHMFKFILFAVVIVHKMLR